MLFSKERITEKENLTITENMQGILNVIIFRIANI